jgi:hypothetical protein
MKYLTVRLTVTNHLGLPSLPGLLVVRAEILKSLFQKPVIRGAKSLGLVKEALYKILR